MTAAVVPPVERELTLLVLEGPDAGRSFIVDFAHVVIGRAPDCRVRLEAPGVSRRHAAIWREIDGTIWIRDLGSKFGIHLEGTRIERAQIRDGARIQLAADTTLLVRECDPRENRLLERLKEAAMTDELTGVGSRRYLLARLDEEISFAERHRSQLGVMLIDLDYFKLLNDRRGHAAGDEALRLVANLLRNAIRNEDAIGRYGGDEFLLLARDLGPQPLASLAKRLCDVVLVASGKTDQVCTLSIGAVCYEPTEKGVGSLDLVLRADAALYASKARGRNTSTLWTPTLRSEVLQEDLTRETMETAPEDLD
jgi:two-component system, cell cycle response regulator